MPAKNPNGKRQQRIARAQELVITGKDEERPGRPTKYRPEMDEMAHKLCLLGATNAKLADFFKVSEQTIGYWIAQHDSFSHAILEGREMADAEIAKALYHRAKGYSHAEDDIRSVAVGGGVSQIVITPTIKHYPPDTAAASLWLRNRNPEKWREKVDIDARVQVDAVEDLRAFLSASRLPIKEPT